MYSLKTLLVFTLIYSFIGVYSQKKEDQRARLLVSKQVLNKLLVQDSDILVKYTIYNVGSAPATNVILQDNGFPTEAFASVKGNLNMRFKRIPAGANVTHAVVIRPLTWGRFNFSAAIVQYKPTENVQETQIATSSEPGEGYIISYAEYDKKFSPHVLDWLAFAIMSLPAVAAPFMLWWFSKSKYELILKQKREKASKD
ncbi:translocon-associated protein subunit beta [Daktulosphaira vitifoliae]|uniref:Translocon-associated protein subunit beta n=1 Tax=Daktulosphaira vitifoliae TaxID=58002 RepID=A0A481SV61_DAKVI|nr:translocon-associated protein subunit beta [Daktulosphaira vitifoliae]QBH72905.1 translocon-associated protein, beta subunit precursor [Daktulosphaira vitifoliae]